MSRKLKIHFKDELRATLLKYALFPVVVIVSILLIAFQLVLQNNLQSQTKQVANEVESIIYSSIEEAKNFLKSIAEEIDIDKYISNKKYFSKINASIFQQINFFALPTHIFILDENKKILFSSLQDEYHRQAAVNRIKWLNLDSADNVAISISHSMYNNIDYNDIIFTSLLDFKNKSKKASIYILLSGDQYLNFINSKNINVVVSDSFNSKIFSNTDAFNKEFGKVIDLSDYHNTIAKINDYNYYFFNSHIKEYGINISCSIYFDPIISNFKLILFIVIFTFIIFVIVIFISTKRISNKKTQIIYEIINAFKKAREGDLDTKLNINTKDEFLIISETYNEMIKSIKSLIQRNKEISNAAVQAKIKQLESEFNPHFLFNTLENIRFMTRLNPKLADEMIVKLSRLLRYSIKPSVDDMVTFSEDILHTTNYLELLKYRFGDKLEFNIDYDIKYSQYLVPKLIMQPIIENSLKYSSENDKKILVNIKAYQQKDSFIVEINDNGIGISKDKMDQIEKIIEENNGLNKNHMGLFNVHNRLKLMYGDKFGIKILSCVNQGTSVKLFMPALGGTNNAKSVDC